MGLLQEGKWVDRWYDTKNTGGHFKRTTAQFRHWVTASGEAGPSGDAGFNAEAGRYHLYVSHACPWANRTVIFRALKGLEEMIGLSIVHWHMAENGWTFESDPDTLPDTIHQAEYMYQVYTAAIPDYSGRVTVPVLWDTEKHTIVSNESSEIIRMFNSAFDHLGAKAGDYYPEEKRAEIDALNERIYTHVNNGVYRAGFATTQDAYEEAVVPLFQTLDWLEERLSQTRYLIGATITEADWRLFTTLIRFDAVYVGHFKCNIRRIADYPNLSGYVRDLYQQPSIAETINMRHIKYHYYGSHQTINPTGIVPRGPELNFMQPHGREGM